MRSVFASLYLKRCVVDDQTLTNPQVNHRLSRALEVAASRKDETEFCDRVYTHGLAEGH